MFNIYPAVKKIGPAVCDYSFIKFFFFLSTGVCWGFDDKEYSIRTFRKISVHSANNTGTLVCCS